ncbi:MAG: esterase family protein [Bifidobacteriaceae bacterium]|jgi:S-formylglutathione hydrolase FrmB|nr:esterase family protein [Bifidobacteriaceae bacterium]
MAGLTCYAITAASGAGPFGLPQPIASPAQAQTRDFFASLPFAIGFAVVGALLLVAAIWLLRKRRERIKGRKALRWTSYVAGSLSLVLGLAFAANWYAGWLPNVEALRLRLGLGDSTREHAEMASSAPHPKDMGDQPVIGEHAPLARPQVFTKSGGRLPRGATREFSLPASASLNLASDAVWIYTPPGYDPSGRVAYPVIYLLHGSPGGPVDWIASGAPEVLDQMITSGELAPVIAVAPALGARAGTDSGCLDSTKPGGSQIETFVSKTVRPWVENHFPVTTDRAASAIGGMSMGGYCAIDQGLRHADQYGTVLSEMPYGSPGAAGGTMKSSQAEIDAVTPLKYISSLPLIDRYPVAAWFAVPDAEVKAQVGQEAEAMAKALRERGQVAEVFIAPNQGHTWKMAIAALPDGLHFWQSQLNKIE